MEPDVTTAFNWANEQPERYIMVLGHQTVPAQTLRISGSGNDKLGHYRTHITGHSASLEGFDKPFDAEVTEYMICGDFGAGDFCAERQISERMISSRTLYFLRVDQGETYAIAPDLCGSTSFHEPSPRTLRRAIRCLRGGACR